MSCGRIRRVPVPSHSTRVVESLRWTVYPKVEHRLSAPQLAPSTLDVTLASLSSVVLETQVPLDRVFHLLSERHERMAEQLILCVCCVEFALDGAYNSKP